MTEKMKPSGIAWIGDIPTSWKVKKIKYYTEIVNGSTPDSSDLNCWDGPIKWITPADMDNTGIISEGERTLTQYGYNSCGTTMLPKGSVVISSRAPIGKINITGDVLCTNQGCKSLVCESDNRYLYYLLLAGQEELVRLGRGTTFVELSTFDLANFGIVLPTAMEQQAIADFLDTQCAKIDSVIADIEKQIEILQKYKKSLITEAVTKGLDRSAPMKDSGIEWIGKIPAHWGTNRLRYVASVKTGPFGTQLSADEYVDEGVPIINVKNIGYGSILAEDLDFVPENVADRLSVHRLKLDDIVFGRKGAVDKHAIITNEYVNWVQGSDCIRVRSNPEINSGYLNYLFDSTYFGSYVMLYAVGATMPSMSSDILLNARILVPPVQEQRDIAAYLNKQCGKINAIITNKQAQLDTIRSHKKSLIYEYVTGKKQVTEVN